MPPETGNHWILKALSRAGMTVPPGVDFPSDAVLEDVWKDVAQALMLTEKDIAGAVAKAFRLEVANLEECEAEACALLAEDHAWRFMALPLLVKERRIMVATANPLDFDAEREIGFLTGRNVEFQVAAPAALRGAIEKAYSADTVTDAALDEASDQVTIKDELALSRRYRLDPLDGPIAKLLRLTILEAVRKEATGIHLESPEEGGQIRFHIAGDVIPFTRPPRPALKRLSTRLKTLAGLGASDHRPAQAGILSATVEGMPYELHVSAITRGNSEKIYVQVAIPGGLDLGPLDKLLMAKQGVLQALIVDDDPMPRFLMRNILEQMGMEVFEAEDGEGALQRLEGFDDFSLMILDLKMPGMDGLELLEKVRSSPRRAWLPVMILTESENPHDKARLEAARVDDYLQKPINPPVVAERIRTVLKRSGVVFGGDE